MKTAIDNRKRLIKLANGEPQRYEIIFSVDVKGNITIWGGEPCDTTDMFIQQITEDYLWLYDGWNHGGDLARMEREMADKIPRRELIKEFLLFREKHPFDGYGLSLYGDRSNDGIRIERDDKTAVIQALKERNRQYIFEMYGEHLPIDFDFKKDYDNRLMRKTKVV